MMCAVCGTFHDPALTSCPPLAASGHAAMPVAETRYQTHEEQVETFKAFDAAGIATSKPAQLRTVRVRIAVAWVEFAGRILVRAEAIDPLWDEPLAMESVRRRLDGKREGLHGEGIVEADMPIQPVPVVAGKVVES